MGPGIVSDSIEKQQLYLTLHDSAGTYRELVGVTMDTVMHTMHTEFQNIAIPFRKIKGYQTLFRSEKRRIEKWK
jgi:S-adenosylmethionine:tRNA-ribosyltransferase-isomerase (queuine synthetase)